MQFVKHYKNNDTLRHSFNALAEKTFGLNFENWYQNGFWGDNYIPYSVVVDGQVVANVSVNRTDLLVEGQRKRLLQLGTVMTEEAYRNRGYIRLLMAEIEKDHQGYDGMYLFANDSVVEFYPKFGFHRGAEYAYAKAVSPKEQSLMKQVPMSSPADWGKFATVMEEYGFHHRCDMVDNPGLIFFYVSQFLQDCVFYCKELDVWVIAEQDGDTLTLHNAFSKKPVDLNAVIDAFGGGVRQVTLGFSPADTNGFTKKLIKEDDCTFFIKGDFWGEFEEKGLRIPTLAHA